MSKATLSKMTKRALAVFFAVVLIVSMFPYSGTAYGEPEQGTDNQTAQQQACRHRQRICQLFECI